MVSWEGHPFRGRELPCPFEGRLPDLKRWHRCSSGGKPFSLRSTPTMLLDARTSRTRQAPKGSFTDVFLQESFHSLVEFRTGLRRVETMAFVGFNHGVDIDAA